MASFHMMDCVFTMLVSRKVIGTPNGIGSIRRQETQNQRKVHTILVIGLLIPLLGTMLGSAFVFFDERRNVGTSTEVAVGLCLWCDGGGIGMVVAHTRNGDGSRQRQMERYACGSWIPVGHRVPIGA